MSATERQHRLVDGEHAEHVGLADRANLIERDFARDAELRSFLQVQPKLGLADVGDRRILNEDISDELGMHALL